jgi:hypothetical protein
VGVQSFFLMHSLGGGTGSGLGSYILGLLEENFPEVETMHKQALFSRCLIQSHFMS